MRFLDANIILRYLTRDDEAKAQACFELFQKVKDGREEITTCEAILTEVVYVLSSRAHYRLSHEDVSARLRPIVALRGLRLQRKRVYLRALDLYAGNPSVDFEDVLSVAYMESHGISQIYSYDTDFDRLSDIQRVEP